jgi:tetratricopeptide (TPR) repeat protein
MELGRVDEALATLQALQKLDPLNSKITSAIQQIMNARQSRQDVPQLEAAYSNNPKDFNTLAQLGQAYVRVGQTNKIGPLLQGYLAQPDIGPDNMLQAAQGFMNLNQPDSAVNALKLMVQRFPQDPRSYYSIALVRSMQGNTAEALPMLAKALELGPQLRAKVPTEQAFSNLRGNPQFQQIISAP